MRILLVEDDELKRDVVVEFLQSAVNEAQINEARSFQSGLRAMLAGHFDVVILDMTMPTFDISEGEDGGRPQPYAGREMLRQMKRRGLHIPTLVLTQFDRFGEGGDALTLAELDEDLKQSHPENYRGAIYYAATDEEWKQKLQSMLLTVRGSSKE
jgi:DNA-binding NarL/FixJ family response regulator